MMQSVDILYTMQHNEISPAGSKGGPQTKNTPFLIQIIRNKLFYFFALIYGLGKAFLAVIWLFIGYAIFRSQLPNITYSYFQLIFTSSILFIGELAFSINTYLKTRGE